jgi:D-glycero-alpha-D-manno-heptose-7-phosphate kinase
LGRGVWCGVELSFDVIVVQAPLRISFFGGGTDLPAFYTREPGCVLSTAIDKRVFVIAKERFDDLIYVNYSRKEIVERVDDLEHGLVREAMRLTGVSRGVEITTLADVPSEGSGLGSSSSITVALLLALYVYQGESPTAARLMEEACRIEIDILGKPIGKQDQVIAAYGGLRQITFQPDHTVTVERVNISDPILARFGRRLMLFYTGRTRSADTILKDQVDRIPESLDALRAMRAQVAKGRDALQQGDLDRFGQLLHEAWQLKRELAGGISNGQIDSMYETARRAGALGGKITGAGGGGFLLLCVPPAAHDAVREALPGYREVPVGLERDGAKVILNARQ